VQTFHCTHCQNLVFFENVRCLSCGHSLAYLPDQNCVAALAQDQDGRWRLADANSGDPTYSDRAYKLCSNYTEHDVCNWATTIADPETLCQSCRLTQVIPDLGKPGNQAAWYRLETAKRRLIYTLLRFKLPLVGKSEETPGGLSFEFLNDTTKPNGDRSRVMTGHDNGVITINVAEAYDVYREQQRTQQNEPYRTLLGHFRHEIGHYYWDQLIQNSPRIEEFRATFGDERADYQAALNKHYENGPPANWEQEFISAYASSHPWEDWAESWAHVLHMSDALETAQSVGLQIKPRRADEPSLSRLSKPPVPGNSAFDQMIQAWLSLTYVLNNLTRGLGLPDSYPFVLSTRVIDKLRFVFATMTP
jgi:hypothetical protein